MILLFLQGQLVQKKNPLSIDQVLHSVTLLLLHVAVQTFYTANIHVYKSRPLYSSLRC